MKEITFSVGDHTLRGLESGPADAPILLAFHGWLDNAASFNELRQHFTDYRFIALDMMGHGYSDHRPISMPYYIWDNVADVRAVVAALTDQPITLIGHSMGASIATLFAGAFPAMVKQLFLIEGLAPLVYKADELPSLMADAIVKRERQMSKTLRPYACKEDAIRARVNGRWPVNQQGAEWLIERGLKETPEGFIWRSDPGLMLPSIVRLSEDHVTAFMQAVEAPVSLYLGHEGLHDESWDRRIELLTNCSVSWLPGNHHLHLYSEPAQAIAVAIREQL
ncbi:alpha/beta fold hydrolase [Neptunomonas marina]|uniref:Alpha/beta fold hydrolase n=1 Tax=Neptunomonas marina TaxID=1815562 RepID=A0A437Q8S0_9GAMM|nr:alpha/beta fold hydrolase [Neptunomonas marina]RVU30938.1 alpha/beta fold hydrolase [Neptunomonas marina]